MQTGTSPAILPSSYNHCAVSLPDDGSHPGFRDCPVGGHQGYAELDCGGQDEPVERIPQVIQRVPRPSKKHSDSTSTGKPMSSYRNSMAARFLQTLSCDVVPDDVGHPGLRFPGLWHRECTEPAALAPPNPSQTKPLPAPTPQTSQGAGCRTNHLRHECLPEKAHLFCGAG